MDFSVARKLLLGSKLPVLEQGCLRSFLARSVWTRARLANVGLCQTSACKYCGKLDTLEHRTEGGCGTSRPLPQELRQFLEDPEASASDQCLRAQGYLKFEVVPPPCDSMHFSEFWSADGAATPKEVEWSGLLFTDGSCSKHPCKQVNRAGWGTAKLSNDGSVLATLAGPVGRCSLRHALRVDTRRLPR